MLDFELGYIFILYFVFLVIHLIINRNFKVIFINSVFFIYILGVISVTLFPIPIDGIKDFVDAGIEPSNNFIPFKSISELLTKDGHIILRQIGGNFILLLPLGFLLPLIWEKRRTFWKAFQVGFLATLGIEITQFLISSILGYTYKIFDVDDIILNSAGFIVGYFLFKLYMNIRKNLINHDVNKIRE